MNIFVLLLLLFSLIGLFDKMTGYRMGLAQEFDKGIDSMGTLVLCLVGFYSVGLTAARHSAEHIAALTAWLPVDPSIVIGCILAPDIGAQPIALELAAIPLIGKFSGVIVAGCLGQFVSFQLPVLFAMVGPEEKKHVLPGFVQGIVAVPFGLLAGGILLRLPLKLLLINTGLIVLLCTLLAISFFQASARTVKALFALGGVIRTAGQLLFLVVIVGLFVPRLQFAENDLLHEALVVVLKMVVSVCGALVFAKACLRYFTAQLEWAARKLHTNEASVMGLALSCINTMAIVPLLPEMDRNGLRMNAAFAVSGSYLLGGQMAFIANLGDNRLFAAWALAKLVAGAAAVGITVALNRREDAAL